MADFWQTNPKTGRVEGRFTNAASTSLNFSFDVSEWLADAGDGLTAGALGVTPGAGLKVVEIDQVGAVITARIERDMAVEIKTAHAVPITLDMAASDGQRDSRRFWLVMR